MSAVEPDRRKAETKQPRLKQTQLSHNPSHKQLWRQSSTTVTEKPKSLKLKQSQPSTIVATVTQSGSLVKTGRKAENFYPPT